MKKEEDKKYMGQIANQMLIETVFKVKDKIGEHLKKNEKRSDALLRLCRDRKLWIQTHNFPDPDAVASAFAMAEFLNHFGIEAELCHDGEIDKLSTTKMLTLIGITMKRASEIGEMKETDGIILVDCQKNTGNTTDFIGDEIAVVDHHPYFAESTYLYTDIRQVGSCSTLVADYFREAGIEPSQKAATVLLYGMRTDTLQLSRGVTPLDIEIYGYLFNYADQQLLKELETNNIEFQDLQGYGATIRNIKVYGVVGFSYLDFECPEALVGMLSDFLLNLVEVEVVVLYAKRADGIKFSFRSERPDVDAGMLAREGLKEWGSGGGHMVMAGGFVPTGILPQDPETRYEVVQNHFVDLIRKMNPEILM